MAWSASAVFRSYVTDAQANAQAFDLSGAGVDTFNNALYNNSITPDKDAAEAATRYNTGQWATANEVYEAGQWAQGGVALTSPALTNPVAGVTMWDATDTASGAAADLASVFGCQLYDTTLVNDPGICYLYFGGSNSVVNGTFTVVYHGDGLFRATN